MVHSRLVVSLLGSGRIKTNLVQTGAREFICNTLAKFTISDTRCECTFRYTISTVTTPEVMMCSKVAN
jgi:hypothetical protein